MYKKLQFMHKVQSNSAIVFVNIKFQVPNFHNPISFMKVNFSEHLQSVT